MHAKITKVCAMFASYTPGLSRGLLHIDPDLVKSLTLTSNEALDSELSGDRQTRVVKLSDNLHQYEHNFGRNMKILLQALNYYAATETVVLLGLCARLSTALDGGGDMEDGEGENQA